MLSTLNLHQHVMKPTRRTSGKAILIDPVISNIETKISYVHFLPSSSLIDHDAVYACVNVKVSRFEKGTYKYKLIYFSATKLSQ